MSSESQNMKTAETAVVGNGSTNMHVARIWLSNRHAVAATDAHNNWSAVGSGDFVWPVPRLYNKDRDSNKYLVMNPRSVLLSDWLTDRQSQCDFDFDYERVERESPEMAEE
jgi:hypothetical protein